MAYRWTTRCGVWFPSAQAPNGTIQSPCSPMDYDIPLLKGRCRFESCQGDFGGYARGGHVALKATIRCHSRGFDPSILRCGRCQTTRQQVVILSPSGFDSRRPPQVGYLVWSRAPVAIRLGDNVSGVRLLSLLQHRQTPSTGGWNKIRGKNR